ncbi:MULTISPECIES: hypothetical protein [Streptomyces]|uniref:hypothetical protein n=1 Tax=Streptomyces TaxID=1883 RepID=UPI002119F0F0|nr:hypothetical protein [Streptomyces hilarionis]MCQ9135540.1 hypothetical protein [Streptomyces hilarionis]
MIDAIVAGAFALGGVATQFGLTAVSARRQERRAQAARHGDRRRELYANVLLAARRAQRRLKDLADGLDAHAAELEEQLGRLAELNAMLRLTAPDQVSAVATALEDEMRGRFKGQRSNDEPLPLAPLIEVFRRDLEGGDGAGGAR